MSLFLTVTILVLLAGQVSFAPFYSRSDHRSGFAADQSDATTAPPAEHIPTIAFCELVRNPHRYFDKTVRLTATLEQATETQYLRDDQCEVSRDDQIGAGYAVVGDEQRDARDEIIRKIRSREFGSRAIVTVTGILRNKSRRGFAWYRYRFDLIAIEALNPVIVSYEGELQATRTYRAAVRRTSDEGLSLVIPLRMPRHYAVHIVWTNLSEFPSLKRQGDDSPEREIVFTVLSDELKQMAESRWNRTVVCRIISAI